MRSDLLKHLLRPRIVRRCEVAHDDGHLHDLPRVRIPHALRRAVGIEAHAPLLAGVVEGLLVRVGREPVAAAEFLNELPRILAGAFTAKGGGEHEPGTVLLGQRIHRLRVDVAGGEPTRRQPAALGGRRPRRTQGEQRDRDEHEKGQGGEAATAHW